MTPATPDDVRRKARVLFGDAADEALRVLDDVPSSFEPERVRLAVLRLSEGRMDRLRHFAETATKDGRDVLAWAEYEESFALAPGADVAQRRQAEQRDRASYEAWLAADRPPSADERRADRRRVAAAQFDALRDALRGRLVEPTGRPDLDAIRDEFVAAANVLLRDGRLDAAVTTRLRGLLGDGVTPGPEMDARLRLFLLLTSVLAAAARADEARS